MNTHANKTYRWYFILFVFLLFSIFLLEQTKTSEEKANAYILRTSAEKASSAFSAIKKERLARGHTFSADDPNETGMVGKAYTEITTTLGNLEAKRSTANPNTAAMITDMLLQCGVQRGDTVAVNLSGSFPCLNVGVLCALDTIGAKGIIICSFGASSYGANLPDMTYPDMEHILLKEGIIQNHSTYFSIGGADDIGKEMPDSIKTEIISRLTGYGMKFLYFDDLNENIHTRLSIYQNEASPVCFVNVGGNLLSFGGGTDMISTGNGIILPDSSDAKRLIFSSENTNEDNSSGLIPSFLKSGIPVIHLLNMKTLLPSHGLPYDPIPLPEVGEGGIYTKQQYNRSLAFVLLMISALLLIKALRSCPPKKIPL